MWSGRGKKIARELGRERGRVGFVVFLFVQTNLYVIFDCLVLP